MKEIILIETPIAANWSPGESQCNAAWRVGVRGEALEAGGADGGGQRTPVDFKRREV